MLNRVPTGGGALQVKTGASLRIQSPTGQARASPGTHALGAPSPDHRSIGYGFSVTRLLTLRGCLLTASQPGRPTTREVPPPHRTPPPLGSSGKPYFPSHPSPSPSPFAAGPHPPPPYTPSRWSRRSPSPSASPSRRPSASSSTAVRPEGPSNPPWSREGIRIRNSKSAEGFGRLRSRGGQRECQHTALQMRSRGCRKANPDGGRGRSIVGSRGTKPKSPRSNANLSLLEGAGSRAGTRLL